MPKLTDTQLIVLSSAAARDDGMAIPPEKLNAAAIAKVGASLISRDLMREVETTPGMPVWREDAEGRRFGLLITQAGRQAIGVEEELVDPAEAVEAPSQHSVSDMGMAPTVPVAPARPKPRSGDDGAPTIPNTQAQASPPSPAARPRAGSKQALLITMLLDENGATLEALAEATGWLGHTVRAALTGLRKRGFVVTGERRSGRPSLYRIVETSPDTAA